MRISDWSSDVCSSDLSPIFLSALICKEKLSRRIGVGDLPSGNGYCAITIDDETARFDSGWFSIDHTQSIHGWNAKDTVRSEARSVGQESVSTCRSRLYKYT